MKKNDNLEKAFEILLAEAAKKSVLSDGKELLSKEIPEHEFSEKHKNEIKKIFKKSNKIRLIAFVKKNKTLVASFVAIILVLGITVPNTKAIKSVFLDYFFNEDAPFSIIQFNNGESASYKNEKVKVGYVPTGFNNIHENITKKSCTLSFEKDSLWFSFRLAPQTQNKTIDTETATVEEIDINGTKALLSVKPDVKILVWSSDNYALVMDGNIDKETLIKIAKSITVLE